MSTTAGEAVPEPVGGRTGTAPVVGPGLRPREARVCASPARARRIDRRPRPRLRPLAEVLAEHAGSADRPASAGPDPDGTPLEMGGPAWDAALEAAAAQVGPLAVGLLTTVAEVLDGRRPLAHLTRLCPPSWDERGRALVERAAPGFPRGARVRGLRVCPVVGAPGPDGTARIAVEVAAALCGDGGRRARAAAARFELAGARTWRVAELAVL